MRKPRQDSNEAASRSNLDIETEQEIFDSMEQFYELCLD